MHLWRLHRRKCMHCPSSKIKTKSLQMYMAPATMKARGPLRRLWQPYTSHDKFVKLYTTLHISAAPYRVARRCASSHSSTPCTAASSSRISCAGTASVVTGAPSALRGRGGAALAGSGSTPPAAGSPAALALCTGNDGAGAGRTHRCALSSSARYYCDLQISHQHAEQP